MEVGAQNGVCRAKGTNARGQGHSAPQVLPFREPKVGSVSSGVYIADWQILLMLEHLVTMVLRSSCLSKAASAP